MIKAFASVLSPAGPQARLTVLIFHRVLPSADPLFPSEPDVKRFGELLCWLKDWFRILPLELAVEHLRRGTLPARAAAITFDDGYADNVEHAMPLLRLHQMSATFFVASGFLDGGCMFNDAIIEGVRRCAKDAVDIDLPGFGRIPLLTTDQRRAAIDRLIGHVKYLGTTERQAVVECVLGSCGVDPPRDLMMTTRQLLRLRDGGMPIGAHTRSHPILARMPDESALDEIVEGKRDLERALQQPVTLFAYPNGKPGRDYRDVHAAMVRHAGFAAALSTASGAAGRSDDHFQIPRFTPWDRTRLRFGLRLLRNLRAPIAHAPA